MNANESVVTQLKDACEVIEAQEGNLDWAYIEKWCADLGVTGTLADARENAGL